MTNKNKRYELDKILTESQRLNIYDPNKKTRKGFTELSFATSSLNKQELTGGNKTDIVDQKAFRLLSQYAFDAEGLLREVNSMELKAQYDPVERLEGTDIEGYLLHHHDMIILSAIDESRKIAEEDVFHIQKKWAADEWATSRRQLMDSLGHRNFINQPEKKSQNTISQTPIQAAVVPQSIGKDISSIYLQTPGSVQSHSFPTPLNNEIKGSFQENQNKTQPARITNLEQSDLIRNHANIVRQLRTNPEKQSNRTPSKLNPDVSSVVTLHGKKGVNPATLLANQLEGATRSSLLADAHAVGMKDGDLSAYRNLLHLLASMTGNTDDNIRPAGYFSPVALDHSSLSPSSILERRKILSLGSRNFLEKQYENMILAKVDTNRATLLGRDDSLSAGPNTGKNRLEKIRLFTSLKVKARQIPSICGHCIDNPMAFGLVPPQRGSLSRTMGDAYNGVPIWPQVYFCLRTGNLKDAQLVLKIALDEGVNGVDEVAYVALGELVKLIDRGNDNTFRPHQISTILSALSKCNALYREIINNTPNGIDPSLQQYSNDNNNNNHSNETFIPDPYRLQVLSLLGLVDLDALCNGSYLSDITVEDFLWTSLWFVHWTQILSNAFTETTLSSDDDLPASTPSFNYSKSYTPGTKTNPPATFSSLNSPLRISSAGDRFKPRYDLIDPLTQTPNTNRERQMTPSGIRRMHTDHLPKVYREGDIYLRVMDAGGSDYFDPGMAAPFTYALILFCCQRFEEAIAHLWHAGRAFPAIHLLVVGLHFGLILPHLPLSPLNGSLTNSEISGDSTPASLLSLWITSKNVPLDACQRADYLLSLNSQWVSFVRELDLHLLEVFRNKSDTALLKALETLICSLDTYDLKQLVGEESETSGMRLSGYLDIYLDRDVINRVLAQTAFTLLTSRRDPIRGLELYKLAGMYVEVIEELCNQLSLVVVVSSNSQRLNEKSNRSYWKEYCEEFYRHINSQSGGISTAVTERLQQAGKLNLRVLFETLLNLCVFVDLYTEKRYQEALELLDNLRLFPSRPMADPNSEDGFSYYVQRFLHLEHPIQRIIDDILIMAVECIYNLYTEAKIKGNEQLHYSQQHQQFNFNDGIQSKEREIFNYLRQRISLLVTFTGYIQKNLVHSTNTIRKLNEIEVRMT